MRDLTKKLRPPPDKEHDKTCILALMRTEASGRSTTAHDCKAAMGMEYQYAYRLLNQLVKEGSVVVSNDAFGRRRYSPKG